MSLDLVWYADFDPQYAFPPKVHYYDDSVGACGIGGAFSYSIAQLDGTISDRGAAAGQRIVPEIGTKNAWWVVGTSNETLYPAELRTGAITGPDGYDSDLYGMVVPYGANPYKTVLAILPDRILCVVAVTYPARSGQTYSETWLASWPRSASAPQVFTYEYMLKAPTQTTTGWTYFWGNVCASDDPECVWIGPMRGDKPDDPTTDTQTIWKYNFVTKKVVKTTSLKFLYIEDVAQGDNNDNYFVGLGWSRKLSRLLLFTYRQVSVVVSEVATPYTITSPEVVGDLAPMRIVSVTPGYPAVLETERSLSSWLAANNLNTGDKIFLSFETFYSGYQRRFITDTDYGGYYWTPNAMTGRTWEITIVDDRHISIPVNAANCRADVSFSMEKMSPEGAQYSFTIDGQVINTRTALTYAVDVELVEGMPIRFGPVYPLGHPLTNQTAELTHIRKWYEFDPEAEVDPEFREDQSLYLMLDQTGWENYVPAYWADNMGGYFNIRDDLGPMPIPNCFMTKAGATAALVSIDLTGPNPVYTVDNPSWLDDLGVTGTTMIRMEGEEIGFPDNYKTNIAVYEAVATRVAPNKFSYAVSSSSVGTTYFANSFTNTVNAIMDSYHYRGLGVGDTVKITDSTGMPALVGAVFHITEVLTDGKLFRTDLDCSAYASPQSASYMPLTQTEFLGRALVTATEHVATYNNDAKIVRVRVLGSRKEPCSGRAVSWSAVDSLSAPAGSFKESVTVTDSDGYAYATYYPANVSGDYTITASVETP